MDRLLGKFLVVVLVSLAIMAFVLLMMNFQFIIKAILNFPGDWVLSYLVGFLTATCVFRWFNNRES